VRRKRPFAAAFQSRRAKPASLDPQSWRIPHIPITRNQRDRLHYHAKAREVSLWRNRVLCFVGRRAHPYDGRARVRIAVYRPRRQDYDNAVGSVKDILDGLQHHGWIKDDHVKWLDLDVIEHPLAGSKERTIIEWEPIP